MKQVRPMDELSAVELLDHLYAELRKLKNLVRARRRRERAMEMVTEMFLVFDTIAKRVSGMTFSEGPVAVEDDDETRDEDQGMPMAELFSGEDESAAVLDSDQVDDIEELRQMIRGLQRSRLDYFRLFLAYFCKGCRQEIDVTKRVLAVVRRVNPALLVQFGLSQADVGRKFGETRASVSAREKSRVERPLKACGARGILSNGARGQATSRACARAAKGNQNRKKKHTAS